MPKPIDLTDHTYGRLTVLREVDPPVYPRKWHCRCECGTEKVITGASLRNGKTQSCGCLNKEILSAKGTVHGAHGTRLYSIWHNMRQRCNNPNRKTYAYYGALGITVCPEWNTFAPFKAWAESSGYEDGLTLDRRDGSQGYSPENCRWVTHTVQSRNQKKRRTNTTGHTGVHYLKHLGKYEVYLTLSYKKTVLGYFDTADEAAAARAAYIKENNLTDFPTD